MEQRVIKVSSNPGELSNEINVMLNSTDLGQYGFAGYSVAFIEQIVWIHVTLAYVLCRCIRSTNPKKATRSRAKG